MIQWQRKITASSQQQQYIIVQRRVVLKRVLAMLPVDIQAD
jgi:hypothetical protein